MNKTSQYILSIYHYRLMIRDTLEYTLVKEKYSLEAYEQRKFNLKHALDIQSPLKNFLDQNGEQGTKISGQLQEFIEEIYSDNSTAVRKSENEIRVDHAQHIKIYNFVVGLCETLTDIINGYFNFAKGNDTYEKEIDDMIKLDDRLYRSICYMTIGDDIVKTFLEFNQAMNESKGQQTPQSNFIVNDLKRLVGFINFVREHNKTMELDFMKMVDETAVLIETMEGKRKFPEGKDFKAMSDERRSYVVSQVAFAEKSWKDAYQPIHNQLVEIEKKWKEAELTKQDQNKNEA